MKTHVLPGTKSEIAEQVARIEGGIHEAIVFIEEPASTPPEPAQEDIFAEMEAFTVNVGGADFSRASIYSPMETE